MKKISRRSFFKTSGLAIGVFVGGTAFKPSFLFANTSTDFEPNAWLTIQKDGLVKIYFIKTEMGQGSKSTCATIVADELGADLNRIEIIQPPQNPAKYPEANFTGFGNMTGGSTTIRSLYQPLRKAGASAREMLESAAAKIWGVNAKECKVVNHQVIGPNNKSLDFSELVLAAQALPVPKNPSLKPDKELNYIAKDVPHFDAEKLARGEATFGIDKTLPNMAYAAIARPPRVYSQVKSFNSTEALKVPGVKKVFQLQPSSQVPMFMYLGGIVVIADNTWAAMEGVKKLEIEWSEGASKGHNSDVHKAQLIEAVNADKGELKVDKGNFEKAYETDSIKLDATYYTPHLAHAPMSASAVVADVKGKDVKLWAPNQWPDITYPAIQAFAGIDPKNIEFNITYLGGGFGSRLFSDATVEAVLISQQIKQPVKLTWSRENDLEGSYLHPVAAQRVQGSVDKKGLLNSYRHTSAFVPILKTMNPAAPIGGFELDAIFPPFNTPNVKIETVTMPATNMKQSFLRAVWANWHMFSRLSFIDELARAAKKDPKDFLIQSIGEDRMISFDVQDPAYNQLKQADEFGFTAPINSKRLKNVIETVADKARWGKFQWFNQGQGIAGGHLFGSYAAAVVDVKVKNGKVIVERVHVGIDCGKAVNPDRVHAQLEGATIFGLSLALMGEITIKDGSIEQNNFDSYPVLRHSQSPEIITHIIDSGDKLGGVGEPGVPMIAPALANAIFDATKTRVRELPINKVFKV